MISYQVDFHPVGQGLFSSGKIFDSQSEFRYVYDCGSTSRKSLHKALANFLLEEDEEASLDLVTISHFDYDHISGLETLLRKCRIRVLMLPMLDLEQRLVLAFAEKIGVEDHLMRFFINPVEYLASRHRDRIEHIVLVPPRDAKTPSPIEELPAEGPLPGLTADLDSQQSFGNEFVKSRINVHYLKVGGRLVAKQVFEFVPYNDAFVTAQMTESFSKFVNKERAHLIKTSSSKSDYQAALARIRDAYDRQFGQDGVKRNVISLFLFAGPIYSLEPRNDEGQHSRKVFMRHSSDVSMQHEVLIVEDAPTCILYTGDGYLDTKKRLDELKDYMGLERIKKIGCFQVMHHGGKGCWHPGVAAALRPAVSVFSSDPTHRGFGHPHAEVVRDFLPFNPVQVDKNRAFRLSIAHIVRLSGYSQQKEEPIFMF